MNKQLQFKCIKELKEGRILIILAKIQGRACILANTCAPNREDPRFFVVLECKLNELGNHPIIWAGDINMIMDGVLDRSSPNKT